MDLGRQKQSGIESGNGCEGQCWGQCYLKNLVNDLVNGTEYTLSKLAGDIGRTD